MLLSPYRAVDPPYFFRILEIMQLVGQELGLPEDVARQLASQTALGRRTNGKKF